jgi:hypothetical protein
MKLKELKKLPSLILLNSEGDILTAYKNVDEFYMVDEHKKTIDVLVESEIVDFINGYSKLTNSEGEVFDYPTFSEGMRPSIEAIETFIYGKKQ